MAFKALPKKVITIEEESTGKAGPSPFGAKIKTLGEMSPSLMGGPESEEESSLFEEHASDIADMVGVPKEKRGEFADALRSAIEACHEGSYSDEE